MTIVEATDIVTPPAETSQKPDDKKEVPENGPSGTSTMFRKWEKWLTEHAQEGVPSSKSTDLRAGY